MRAPVDSLDVSLYRVPLPRPWGADVRSHYIIVSRVSTSDGRSGTGFTWTPQVGGYAVYELLARDCRELLLGAVGHPTVVWDHLWWSLHEAGGGGITTLALAAVDTALWDLESRGTGSALTEVLGKRRDSVAAYGSGVNYDYGSDELVEQAERWCADGYSAVKIKVGHPTLEEDLERVALVRQVIGPHRRLMIDANQRWDLPQAQCAIRALSKFDLYWVEEPLVSDDRVAYQRLCSTVDVPVALGENHRTVFEFRDVFVDRGCHYAQPNVARVGGITPLLRIAALADAFGVPVYPHHLPDISAQLAMCLPTEPMVEDIEDASFASLGMLTSPPVTIESGRAYRTDAAGLGLRFMTGELELLAGGPGNV